MDDPGLSDEEWDEWEAEVKRAAKLRFAIGLSSPIDEKAPVWITRDFRQTPIAEMGDDHLANVIAWIERRTDPHPQRERWLAIFSAERERRFKLKAPNDPLAARVALLEVDWEIE